MQLKYLADLHIHMHEDFPPYRSCSVEDVVKVALERNVRLVGIVEHYGSALLHYKSIENYCSKIRKEIEAIEKKFPGVEVLLGIEASILTVDGELDIKPKEAKILDFLLVGMHHIPAGGSCLSREMKRKVSVGDIKGNPSYQTFLKKFKFEDLIADWQEATLSLMQNPYVSIYAHPVQWPIVVMKKFFIKLRPGEEWRINRIEDLLPPDIAQEIFLEAKRNGVAWEVNNGFLPVKYRVDNEYVCCKDDSNSWSELIELFKMIGEYGVKVSLGTDAHVPGELKRVGRLANAIELLRLAGVSEQNIVLKKNQVKLCREL
ncbi:MAG: hypothetical protein DRN04_02910 [Thermoprotei archaeon]|nr:MAG: hypothetical protein DRN04_02910 [Thermoprotei archaeon]